MRPHMRRVHLSKLYQPKFTQRPMCSSMDVLSPQKAWHTCSGHGLDQLYFANHFLTVSEVSNAKFGAPNVHDLKTANVGESGGHQLFNCGGPIYLSIQLIQSIQNVWTGLFFPPCGLTGDLHCVYSKAKEYLSSDSSTERETKVSKTWLEEQRGP